MIQDAQSNPIAGATPAARDLFDTACEAFATYSGDPVSLFDAASAEAPDCLMIRLARAWCFTLATEPEAAAAARTALAEVAHFTADERAAGHLTGLRAALAGNWTEAARAPEHHLLRFPRDLIALQAGHLLDFLRADARTLRDRIAAPCRTGTACQAVPLSSGCTPSASNRRVPMRGQRTRGARPWRPTRTIAGRTMRSRM